MEQIAIIPIEIMKRFRKTLFKDIQIIYCMLPVTTKQKIKTDESQKQTAVKINIQIHYVSTSYSVISHTSQSYKVRELFQMTSSASHMLIKPEIMMDITFIHKYSTKDYTENLGPKAKQS